MKKGCHSKSFKTPWQQIHAKNGNHNIMALDSLLTNLSTMIILYGMYETVHKYHIQPDYDIVISFSYCIVGMYMFSTYIPSTYAVSYIHFRTVWLKWIATFLPNNLMWLVR